MPIVVMPDGTPVNMPDQIDPALGARLRAFHDTTPHEATTGVPGFLNGIAEIAGKGIGNIPMGAVHGVQDLVSRATGHGGRESTPTFPLSRNAQEVGQSIGGELEKAADPYRIKAAEPFLGENVAPVLGDVASIAPVVGAVSGIAGGVRAAGAASAAETAASAPAAVAKYGLRTAADNPIARNVAGESAQPAVTAHNQSIADPTIGAQAGVPVGTPLTQENLQAAQAAPNSVYARAEKAIPTGPLSPKAAQMVQGIGADDLVVHSPDTQATVETQKARLLSGDLSGSQVVNTSKALRFNGFRNSSSLDPEQIALGRAQLKMSDALHQHMMDTIPANADVSADQLSAARQALAQNHTVENFLKGNNVDLQGLARFHRNNPNILSGPLKDFAEFADLHPEVSALPSSAERFNPSGVAKDVASVDLKSPTTYLQPLFGGMARRALTGAAPPVRAPVTGLGGEFGPIEPQAPQPPPGMTASTPTAPPPAPAGPPGQIPLADLLSHGVEQSSAPGLSASPMGAPPAQGIPFTRDAAHESGELSLADAWHAPTDMSLSPGERAAMRERVAMQRTRAEGFEPQPDIEPIPQRAAAHEGEVARRNQEDLADSLGPFRGRPMDMSDFADVKSQGVPDGTAQRSPSNRFVADTVDFPGGTERKRIVENDSGGGPASLEAQRRLAGEKAAGVRPVIFGDSGTTPLLHDVTAVDRAPPKGHIILDESTGKVLNGGGMKPSAVQALVNRWKASQLGEAF